VLLIGIPVFVIFVLIFPPNLLTPFDLIVTPFSGWKKLKIYK